MNAAQVIDHFDRICDAPDAIPRLRRFVLDLAIRGKLVEQEPTDEPASELLRRIQARSYTGVTKSKRDLNADRPIDDDEIPFPVSPNGTFARLATIAKIEKGSTGIQKAKPGKYLLITLAEDRGTSEDYQFDAAAAIVPLISSTGHGHASLKRMHYQEGKFALGNILCAVIPFAPELVAARFLYEYLWAYKEPLLVEKMIGTANVSLTIGKIGEAPVPIVSPRSQQRLQELMVLCDRLEAAQAERESRRDKLAAVSLHRLNNGANAEEFREHARFHFRHLPRLTTRTEHIQRLRQTILNMAVRGQLVQQSPTDESPNALLSEICEVRAKSPNLSKNSIIDDSDQKFFHHLPAVLPSNWTVCRLDDLFRFVDYRGRTPTRTANGVRLITAKNVRMGYVAEEPIEFINEQVYSRWMTRGFPQNGDLLFVTEGATMGYVGMIDFKFTFALAQRTIDLKPYLLGYNKFFLFTLMSPIFKEAILRNSTGTAVKGIKAAKLKRIRILLPPLAEQHRIVAKVEELLALCDRLEAQLTTNQAVSRRLFEAVLHEASEGFVRTPNEA